LKPHTAPQLLIKFQRIVRAALLVGAGLVAPMLACAVTSVSRTESSFSLKADTTFYTVDTGAGLVFKVRRFDTGLSRQSAGDIASLVFEGVQYQDAAQGSQVNSGFDYLYNGVKAVDVDAVQVDADHIRVTVTAGQLIHYYLAERGKPRIYMSTYFTREPDTLNLARYIVRVPIKVLPNGPKPSDLRGSTGAIEAHDVFGMPNGETRSKHYSNSRLKDWQYFGATGSHVGMWMVRGDNEGNSGGPFYRSLLNQGTDTHQELTYIINYGEGQTEPLRTGILNSYTLVFTHGETPTAIDTSWFANMSLAGYVGPEGRGCVAGVGIAGRDRTHHYTVGFSNAKAQYWTDAADSNGHFAIKGLLPGDYTMTIYKNELAVDTLPVSVAAGRTTTLHTIEIAGDPSTAAALWRIGDWDGTPAEFLNGDKVTRMHPSDVRMAPWSTPQFDIGVSKATDFPAYQWKAVNGSIQIRFTLTQAQMANYVLRAGITTAFANGRPTVMVNGHRAPIPAASHQPSTRTLTVGSYRGNNTMFSFPIPASALVIGTNTVTLGIASGTSGEKFLSPGVAYDAVDFIRAP
jgi:rhamnogalacturonan endolyase